MRRLIVQLWRDESGTECIEYCLLVTLLILPQIANDGLFGITGLSAAFKSYFAGLAQGIAHPL